MDAVIWFPLTALPVVFGAQFLARKVWQFSGTGVLAVTVASFGAAVLLLLVFGRLQSPAPIVDADARVVRIGRETTPFADITEGCISHYETKRRDDLYLWFGGRNRRHGLVALRIRGAVLSDSDREALATMVEGSNIQIPEVSAHLYQPRTRFATMGGNQFAMKSEVLDAVLNTPVSGDIVRT